MSLHRPTAEEYRADYSRKRAKLIEEMGGGMRGLRSDGKAGIRPQGRANVDSTESESADTVEDVPERLAGRYSYVAVSQLQLEKVFGRKIRSEK
jgi:hypothetical protein